MIKLKLKLKLKLKQVASNPVELNLEESIERDMKYMMGAFPETKDIVAFGHSNGGQMLLSYAYKFPVIKKVAAVNAPLMINIHKTQNGIINFNGKK